ncbi:hypothetical protein [Caballeronia sp. LZ034LL]|uniref:hypothetical protein n=1 Tax=Caballeronia sp. LZ034LL TaxID=3038567 RepID=UPI00286574EB|nr:hypothetical protein [Caballeronia sp. LZ034LL]MDR5833282.1 hypothetical protein [Caballeronia sp. LZ034LL]
MVKNAHCRRFAAGLPFSRILVGQQLFGLQTLATPEKRGILPEADGRAATKPEASDYLHQQNDVVPLHALYGGGVALTFSPSQINALGGSKHHVRDSPQQ